MLLAIFRVVIGAIFGVICAFVLSPALAALQAQRLTLLIVVALAALGYFAPTVRRSFGRGFLLLGISFFALPFSALLLSGRAASEVVTATEQGGQAAAAIGAGLGAAVLTGVGTFIWVIFGTIFVVLGLVLALGGRREVVVVQK